MLNCFKAEQGGQYSELYSVSTYYKYIVDKNIEMRCLLWLNQIKEEHFSIKQTLFEIFDGWSQL